MQKRESLYRELAKPEFKSLGYFAEQTFEAKDDFDFFNNICSYIFPLVSEDENFKILYDLLNQEIVLHQSEIHKVIKQFGNEIKNNFMSLKSLLLHNKLLNGESLAPEIKHLENFCMLDQEVNLNFYFVQEAFNNFVELCNKLIKLKKFRIVKKYVEITCIKKYKQKKINNKLVWILYGEPAIKSIKCFPSMKEFFKKQDVFAWDKLDKPFAALEFLKLVTFYWNAKTTDFDEIKIDFKSSSNIENYNSYCLFKEIETIKKREIVPEINSFLFKRDRFTKYLEILLKDIIDKRRRLEVKPNIYSLELSFLGLDLVLYVQWNKENNIETYLIHTFNDDSNPCRFMKACLDSNKTSNIIDASKYGKNLTTSSIFSRAKLSEEIIKVFFEKTSTYLAYFRHNPIKVEDLNGINLPQLFEDISKLKLYNDKK